MSSAQWFTAGMAAGAGLVTILDVALVALLERRDNRRRPGYVHRRP